MVSKICILHFEICILHFALGSLNRQIDTSNPTKTCNCRQEKAVFEKRCLCRIAGGRHFAAGIKLRGVLGTVVVFEPELFVLKKLPQLVLGIENELENSRKHKAKKKVQEIADLDSIEHLETG